MTSSVGGRLEQKPLPALLREIASQGLTGILRLSRDQSTRSLVLDHGRPINAFSSIPSEQLDNRLIKEGRTTSGLVSAVKRGQPDPIALGLALVEKGLVSAEAMQKAARELAAQIALSIFDWTEGNYAFEECDNSSCPGAIDLSAADLIAEGVRLAAKTERVANIFAPPDWLASPCELNGNHFASSARLTSIESYVFSVITKPTKLEDVPALTGLPLEEVRPALCVLSALGLLSLSAPPVSLNVQPADESLDLLLHGIERKLQLFETADFYQVLGVDTLAATTTINEAFDQIQQMFQSYSAEYPDHAVLSERLNRLFGKIRIAHQVLSDPVKRSQYDRSSRQSGRPDLSRSSNTASSGARPTLSDGQQVVEPALPSPIAARKPVPIPVSIPDPVRSRNQPVTETVIERGQTPPPQSKAAQLPARKPIPIPEIQIPVAPKNAGTRIERGQPDNSRYTPPIPRAPAQPLTRPPAVLSPEEASRLRDGAGNPTEQALHFYRQGRARFEHRELDAAEHLFREAVRLDPSQSNYHFNLAVVLSIRAQARHEHMHHEGCHVTCKLGGSLVSNPKVRYEAEQHFLKASEIDPTNALIPLKLGQLYKEARLYKKAEQYLRTAVALGNSVAQQELDTLHETEHEDHTTVAQ